MANQAANVEYIVSKSEYEKAYNTLPKEGVDHEKAISIPIVARQYRQNTSQTINAGKWVMWAIGPETFTFTWLDNQWCPPANLVVLDES